MISLFKNKWHSCSHECYRLPEGISWEIYDTPEALPEYWNQILPENHHLRQDHLLPLAHAGLPDIQFKYLVILKNEKPIGVVYLQTLLFQQHHLSKQIFDLPQLKLLKPLFIHHKIPLLICGNLFRVHQQGFYFADTANNDYIFSILNIYSLRHSFYGILLKDCEKSFELNRLNNYRFQPFYDDITMEIPIKSHWLTFDDYIQNLSRKYLQRAKKILAAASPVSQRDLDESELIRYKNQIYDLYMEVADKQSIKIGMLNADYFIQMKKHQPERFRVVGYFKDNILIGFRSMISRGAQLEIHYIGMNYQYNSECMLYFNILFDGIKDAIDGKYINLELGRTAREAKASAGAQAVSVNNYIQIKQGWPTLAYRISQRFFKKGIGEEWKNRNPFKG